MIIVRFDCGLRHGMGNLVRCSNLIYRLKENDIDCTILSEDNPFAREFLPKINCNIEWKTKGTDEALALLKVIKKLNACVLFIDTSHFYGKELVLALREFCFVAFLGNYSVGTFYSDYVVHPSAHVSSFLLRRYKEALPASCIRQGFNYVLINNVVKETTVVKPSFDLVISFGGTDPYNMLKALDSEIRALSEHSIILVLIGSGYSDHQDYLAGDGEESGLVFKPFSPALLASGRLALTAFGITTYECIYLQKPVLTLGFSSLHSRRAKLLSLRTGCSKHGGIFSTLGYLKLERLVGELESQAGEIRAQQEGKIDGNGYNRIASDLALFLS